METTLSICLFIIGFVMSLQSYKKEAEKWERLYEEECKKRKEKK